MHHFNLPGLTCGHCVYAVTKALKGVDPTARIEIDLSGKRATVESGRSAEAFAAAVAAAGYAVERVG